MFVASYYLLGDLKRRVEVGEGEALAAEPITGGLRTAAGVARQSMN